MVDVSTSALLRRGDRKVRTRKLRRCWKRPRLLAKKKNHRPMEAK